MELTAPMTDLFTSSRVVILDFDQLTADVPADENIQLFFDRTINAGKNPRAPEARQLFNNKLLQKFNCRYLIGRYGEDRRAMLADTPAGKEGRTIHMAIDVFARDLEPVLAPCNGTIARSGYEAGFGEYGNYLVLRPENADYFIFFGHLSDDKLHEGTVTKGQQIARLGDHLDNENGGWSRHLHLQVLKQLPIRGDTPDGYSSKKKLAHNQDRYPNPLDYFAKWSIIT
jgi:murein DD-endopeptidase MepM/ murein hydrolase activator NlpD